MIGKKGAWTYSLSCATKRHCGWAPLLLTDVRSVVANLARQGYLGFQTVGFHVQIAGASLPQSRCYLYPTQKELAMADPVERPINEIYAELASHSEFVCGNYFTAEHLSDAGWSDDEIDELDEDHVADVISRAVFEMNEPF